MKKIVFIAPFSWIGISNPLINTAIYLADKGYQIDIYTVFNKTNTERGINNYDFNNEKINVFILRKNIFQRVKSKISNKKYSYFISAVNDEKYDLYIAFDLEGLRIAAQLSEKTGTKYIFFSLEIEEIDQVLTEDQYIAQSALLTITQSENRKKVLESVYKLAKNNIHILPNSCFGPIIDKNKQYFNELFELNKNIRIVLCIGTLNMDTCVDTLIKSIEYFPTGYCLVVHGWFADEETKDIYKSYKKKYPNRVFYSNEIKSNKDLIYQSCDFGVVAYDPKNENLKYALGASGKMFEFLKYGVPLIVNDIPGAKNLIEDTGCGLVIENINMIPQLLSKINSNYDNYKKNCYKQFLLNQFDKQLSLLIKNASFNNILDYNE